MTRTYPFAQVDVFAARALSGNPLAVVFDAETLDDDEMARRTCGARTPGARRARSSRSAAPAWSGCGWTPTAPWRSGDNVPEDPVTGSLNAAIAQWLTAKGLVPQRYSAQQGRMLGRCGKIRVEVDEGTVWIGGPVHDRVRGTVTL